MINIPGLDGNMQFLKRLYDVDMIRYDDSTWIGWQYAMPAKDFMLLICSDLINMTGMDGNVQCLKD